MIYTNIILTLIFLLLLGIVVGAIFALKIIGKKLKNSPFPMGNQPTNPMMDPSKFQEIFSTMNKNMKK
jgi:uncharacterized protein YneF (UPF0154 family)